MSPPSYKEQFFIRIALFLFIMQKKKNKE